MNRTKATEGFALMTVLVMIVVLIALTTAYFFLTNLETATAQSNVKSTTGFYSAEAGLNLRGEEVRQSFQNGNRPSGKLLNAKTACKNSADYTPVNNLDRFYCEDYTLNGRKVVTYVVQDPANLDPTDSRRTTVLKAPDPFAGLNAIQYRYEVFSESYPPGDTRPEAKLNMVFRSRLIPVFQFAAFYDKDLEIAPGADMTLNGRVHTNGDLYLDASTGATLGITGKITVAAARAGGGGDLYRRRKESGGCTGTVRISDAKDSTNPDPPLACSGLKVQSVLTPDWNEQIQTKMDTITAPRMDSFGIGQEGWQQADLRVALDVRSSPPRVIVPNVFVLGSGNSGRTNFVTENSALTKELEKCEDPIADMSKAKDRDDINNGKTLPRPYTLMPSFSDTDKKGFKDSDKKIRVAEGSQSFYDMREKKTITMLEIDVRGLLECLHKKKNKLFDESPSTDTDKDINDTSQGGLVIYLSVLGPQSDSAASGYGVRVRNGAQLKAQSSGAPEIKGLTIISDQALYVLGNYNQEGVITSGANKDVWKPASFLVDSLNILSNAWDTGVVSDTRSGNNAPLSNRIATDTRVNAAFLSGTDVTGGHEGASGQGIGKYNGGLENYPRLHENWSSRTLTYKGSFVSLDKPRHTDGVWPGTGIVYNAPRRTWSYDERFNDPEQLPPLAPRFVYLRQELFSRNFDR